MTAERDFRRDLDLAIGSDYQILEELGRGSSSVVFHGRDLVLGREVAIKLIRGTQLDDSEAVSRFEREARVLAKLQHPNIVMLYTAKQLADGSLALVMQHSAEWRTLKSLIREGGPFISEAAERILNDVAAALQYLHNHEVVHRDIKPENIFVDESGRAFVADFGIAKPGDGQASVTLTGVVIGTPAYMSPEQIDGIRVTGQSDIYSLGMVGYEMLTGRRPWAGENLYSVIFRQKTEKLPSLKEVRSDVSDRLRFAIEKATEKLPADRWADAAALLAHFEAATPISTPSPAAPPTTTPVLPTAPDEPASLLEPESPATPKGHALVPVPLPVAGKQSASPPAATADAGEADPWEDVDSEFEGESPSGFEVAGVLAGYELAAKDPASDYHVDEDEPWFLRRQSMVVGLAAIVLLLFIGVFAIANMRDEPGASVIAAEEAVPFPTEEDVDSVVGDLALGTSSDEPAPIPAASPPSEPLAAEPASLTVTADPADTAGVAIPVAPAAVDSQVVPIGIPVDSAVPPIEDELVAAIAVPLTQRASVRNAEPLFAPPILDDSAVPRSAPPSDMQPRLQNATSFVERLTQIYNSTSRVPGVRPERRVIVLNVLVNEKGEVVDAELQTSSGIGYLDDAAVSSARLMRFTAAPDPNLASQVWVTVPLRLEP